MRFECVRKFGYISYCEFTEKGALPEVLKNLGVEPLEDEFSFAFMKGVCKKKKTAIKNLIMDNKIVTGIGNIYSAESLFIANVNPLKRANELSDLEIKNIVVCVKKVLSNSISDGKKHCEGKELPDGSEWKYPVDFNVYGRAGEKCQKCSALIAKVKIGGRSCFFCPGCQV